MKRKRFFTLLSFARDLKATGVDAFRRHEILLSIGAGYNLGWYDGRIDLLEQDRNRLEVVK